MHPITLSSSSHRRSFIQMYSGFVFRREAAQPSYQTSIQKSSRTIKEIEHDVFHFEMFTSFPLFTIGVHRKEGRIHEHHCFLMHVSFCFGQDKLILSHHKSLFKGNTFLLGARVQTKNVCQPTFKTHYILIFQANILKIHIIIYN